jgi:hypothetical protein
MCTLRRYKEPASEITFNHCPCKSEAAFSNRDLKIGVYGNPQTPVSHFLFAVCDFRKLRLQDYCGVRKFQNGGGSVICNCD